MTHPYIFFINALLNICKRTNHTMFEKDTPGGQLSKYNEIENYTGAKKVAGYDKLPTNNTADLEKLGIEPKIQPQK